MHLSSSAEEEEMPSRARSVMMPAEARGPHILPRLERLNHENHPLKLPKSICMLTESLIADIPTTEHFVVLYNDVDAPKWDRLPLNKRPNWSDGTQNIFVPKTWSTADGNHHHAVIGTGDPSKLHRTGTAVRIRIGSGGDAVEWKPGHTFYEHLQPFYDEVRDLRVPFGSAVHIRLRFQLDDDQSYQGTRWLSPVVENVAAHGCMSPRDWYDSVRLDINQIYHPKMISLHIRFAESQDLDIKSNGMTRVEMFSISGIELQNQGPRIINQKRVIFYNYLIKLRHSRG
ncbi:hypothetical protein FHETE_3947 [Fusarium heterosporum]|uniref:Uncharacterized protein n=1 Tax=Fusarium heterosporum TaxID=42747 RepID=A0A8H5WVM7_FUSHE|nr:hypothetical protein FHETE_3947 [Fusarium heterosporum]